MIDAAAAAEAAAARADAVPPIDDREAVVMPTDPAYHWLEHAELANDCAADGDCAIDPLGYACTAATAVILDPIRSLPAIAPVGAGCGCVARACVWYRPRGYDGVGAVGRACDADHRCLPSLTCAGDRCMATSIPPPTSTRAPAVLATDRRYMLLEHPEVDNHCAVDRDCAIGGCANYACVGAADVRRVFDACDDAPAMPPRGAACGCVNAACVWWRAPRVAAVAPDDPMRRYYEHDEVPDPCTDDADCEIERGGRYACMLRPAPALHDPIRDLPAPPSGAACGCLAGACAWWRSAGGP